MKEQIINIGSLSSISNLNYHLTKELKILRDSYLSGNDNTPIWDLRDLTPKKVSFSALTSFLAISKTIRDFIGQPIEIMAHWHPEFQGFLADTDFLKISNEFDLYDWKGMLGGYESNKTSPNTRIFYYSNIPQFHYTDQKKIIEWKDLKREEIKRSVSFRLKPIFDNDYFNNQWNIELEAVFTTTISELVVNSLIHGRSTAFVGVQRTRKGITTCVCDSGIGFLKSLEKYKPNLLESLKKSSLLAILYASFHSKNKIGLYRAISDVIQSGGYINISSFDSEILWKSHIWNFIDQHENLDDVLKLELTNTDYYFNKYVDFDKLNKGYFKNYDHFLIGSRITFEIPFNNE
ncbi:MULTISPECIES: hypothetical protein [unclassified Leeuwenhoekiella]|uniref:hypothetical protein n=1 Tax=unclassified Leeuwenhoekiella TaxID=2615029 RepID=UPI000C44FAE4|nr:MULTISPECIES: hypothetical protein [unclassified Leeuwenhoekiella]MAW96876.1 hypothetical protein [Leeuwenhoekiella sp.]|tara:strand:- start:3880 stop:4923 length:1044 start_codon:yes stop_codon:yes gene_type:complete